MVTHWWAPGRINLIGEHTDYNDGFVLPLAIEFGCGATVTPTDDGLLTAVSAQEHEPVSIPVEQLAPGSVDGWAAYVAGVVWALGVRTGLHVAVDSSVPAGAGLSSSAALTCSVAGAVVDAFGLTGTDLVATARKAENDFVGAPTGGMDQLVSVFAEADKALFCDMRSLDVEPVPFDLRGAGLRLVVVDSRAAHQHADGEYATRRRSCEQAARLLGVSALRDVTIEDLPRALQVLAHDEDLQRRVRHVVTEDDRVLRTAELLRAGRLAEIGPLLTASHASMREDFEITVPEVDVAVEAALRAGARGARMTGGGFGGCVIVLADAELVPAVHAEVEKAYAEAGFAHPGFFLSCAEQGAHAATATTTRPLNRTAIRLADGRELVYYDDRPGIRHDAPDRRDLPTTATTSQLRFDPLESEWSVVAGHRQSRTYHPPADECPLDPSRGDRLTEIPDSAYDVVVFENRFPSLEIGSALSVADLGSWPFTSSPGDGRCEVVCFTSDHDTSFSQLPPERARTVIDAWADRTTALSRRRSIDYVYCFENRGEEIGVTLQHPHGQIYGFPFVPPRFARSLANAIDYRDRTGRTLQGDLLDAELEAAERVVLRSQHWVVYVPFAAHWPYEVSIVPRRHVPDLPSLTDDERDDLATVYLDTLRRFDGLFDTPTPYISGWRQAPFTPGRDAWRLSGQVFTIRRAAGKLKFLAGSESGAAVWINDIAPEQAAERLRDGGSE